MYEATVSTGLADKIKVGDKRAATSHMQRLNIVYWHVKDFFLVRVKTQIKRASP